MAFVYGSHLSISDAAQHLDTGVGEVHQLIYAARHRLARRRASP
jgi:DNA-directed RNA polymerase specialized sigma24 family protein